MKEEKKPLVESILVLYFKQRLHKNNATSVEPLYNIDVALALSLVFVICCVRVRAFSLLFLR